MTAKQVLVKNNVFLTEDVNKKFNLDVTRDCYIKTQKDIVKSMQEYAKEKCQELLEIVADKAKIIDEDGDTYQQPHIFFCNGEVYKNWIDKDSIINAIDLDEFIV
jgi:hypothetical protein